jgi:anti-sigma regulatory factor (Ser/Thr protein kinase)
MGGDSRVPVRVEADILAARRAARTMALELGFAPLELTMIATAISEIARNMIVYGGGGEMMFEAVPEPSRRGLRVIAADRGPGIPDVDRAMRDGFSTGKGLGLGLPGARRLMDDFHVASSVGNGTTVTMTKWRRA